jgi:hypothetical protein
MSAARSSPTCRKRGDALEHGVEQPNQVTQNGPGVLADGTSQQAERQKQQHTEGEHAGDRAADENGEPGNRKPIKDKEQVIQRHIELPW